MTEFSIILNDEDERKLVAIYKQNQPDDSLANYANDLLRAMIQLKYFLDQEKKER